MDEVDVSTLSKAQLDALRNPKDYVNDGAYGNDAVPLALGESESSVKVQPRCDPYLGDKVENLMQNENLTITGGGGRSGRRVRSEKTNSPTEQQVREANLRRDQENDLLRPMLAAGKVSVVAHEALYSQEYSVGEMMDIVGRAILTHGSFDAVREKMGIEPRNRVA